MSEPDPSTAANAKARSALFYTRLIGTVLFILLAGGTVYTVVNQQIKERLLKEKIRQTQANALNPYFNKFVQDHLPGAEDAVASEKYPGYALIAPDGFIAFDTKGLAGDIDGFNGPLRLFAVADKTGKLIEFTVAEHDETPSYFDMTAPWQKKLPGRNMCHPDFTRIQIVSGATYTSQGILDTLGKAAKLLIPESADAKAQGELPSLSEHRPLSFNGHGIYLVCAILLAVVCRFVPSKRLRYVVLAGNMLLGGWWLGAQFSTFHVLNLAKLQLPPIGLTPIFICFAGLPLVMLFTGNIYCGWICPFGALQELSTLTGRGETNPRNGQFLRFGKYLILCAAIGGFLIWGNDGWLAYDPLNFAYTGTTILLVTAGAVFLLAQFLPVRFFCRYLCPTGAFLSLFNRVFLLKKFFPYLMPGKCDLGIKSLKETDCLLCDRCRNGCAKKKV